MTHKYFRVTSARPERLFDNESDEDLDYPLSEKPVSSFRKASNLVSEKSTLHKLRARAYIKRLSWTTVTTIVLTLIIAASTTCWFLFKFSGSSPHEPALSLEELRNMTYSPGRYDIEWLPNGVDGLFSELAPDGFRIGTWNQSDSMRLTPASFSYGKDNNSHKISKVLLNNARTHAVVATEVDKHWRHSTFANYWITELGSDVFEPITDSKLSVVSWSSSGKVLAYVLDNNIYLYDVFTNSTKQVTQDGGANVFNGIPDWVYEEEVFAGDSALWWSTNGDYLAFMRTNDSLVPKYTIPYFLSKEDDSNLANSVYPSLVELKYPKPGFANPQVELWVVDAQSNSPTRIDLGTKLDQPIIMEVIWVGEQAVVKLVDRQSDNLEVWIVDPKTHQHVKSRSYNSKDIGGSWFEVTHNSHAVGTEGYVDIIDVDGFNHLAYFNPVNSSEPTILTRGSWEVRDLPIAVHQESGYVYFHAAKRSSMETTIYRVSIDHPLEQPHEVGFEGQGIYSADFSPDVSFVTITFSSVSAPLKQKVLKLNNSGKGSSSFENEWRLKGNSELHDLLASRKLLDDRLVTYGTVHIGDGISVNYREVRPTNFDETKKHPLLFYNYGGPGSQTVRKQLEIDFQRVYAETHNAVILTVDPRGTAGRGRKFLSTVRDHLGEFEADDVISVAKIWNSKPYIDESSTAIWGWSYGGFLTLKTLERDSDLAFKYGVAVAPVTDWALYDSIYTERYMHMPSNNVHGYEVSKVSNVTNLARHNRFLIMHGTGDDNVHFQNTLTLLDNLDLAGIENYDVHVFPDSDHSISFHNANAMVFDRVDQWLGRQQSSRGK